MQKKYKVPNPVGLIAVLALSLFLPSCRSDRASGGREVSLENYLSADDIFDDIDKAKKIFYSLPSPLETAMILKSAGVQYNDQLLNDLNRVDGYVTNKSQALNLGIYTTDLSFASLFDQSQTSLNYMDAVRRLANEMGISDAVDEETLNRLEQNLNNREIVMDIISETFLNSSSYLKENDQQAVAAIVLVGGWVEGLYIGTMMAGSDAREGNELADRIAEQKLSFSIVERMLEDNRTNADGSENRDITELIGELEELRTAFEGIEVQTSAITVDRADSTGISSLQSQTKLNYSPGEFKTLSAAIQSLRTGFTQ